MKKSYSEELFSSSMFLKVTEQGQFKPSEVKKNLSAGIKSKASVDQSIDGRPQNLIINEKKIP